MGELAFAAPLSFAEKKMPKSVGYRTTKMKKVKKKIKRDRKKKTK